MICKLNVQTGSQDGVAQTTRQLKAKGSEVLEGCSGASFELDSMFLLIKYSLIPGMRFLTDTFKSVSPGKGDDSEGQVLAIQV